jgi:Xaa-Pro dipeptidase
MIERATLAAQYREHIAQLQKDAAAALAAEGFDGIAIHSGSLVKRSEFDDQYWPLRVVPHFSHWAHIEWPDVVLHFVPGRKPRLLFHRDESFWERVPEPDFEMLGSALELVELKTPLGFSDALQPKSKLAFIGENAKRANEWGIANEAVNPKGLLGRLDELRVFKSDYEVSCLREANQIAARGHVAVRDAFLAGARTELDLHLLYLKATSQDDPETPYKNIVAVGDTAAILHHVHYRRAPVDAKSLLLDAGAMFHGYASDITRTYAMRDTSAAGVVFTELVARMDQLQLALIESVRLGRQYESLHDEAHDRLGVVLTETGIVKMSAAECVSSGVSRKFLPHGLGHSLGVQTHDVGCAKIRPRNDNPWLRNTRVIEPRQVFTIEPGVYFVDTLMEELRASPQGSNIDWNLVEGLKSFGGIRIEDDVFVTSPGAVVTENMTRAVL